MAVRTTDQREIVRTLARGNRFEVVGYRVDTPPGSQSVTLFPQVADMDGETRVADTRLPDQLLSQADMNALMADAGARYEAYRALGVPAASAMYASHRDAIYAFLKSNGTFPADAETVA